ncbi:MAG: metallophosphoesterase family protein [Gammaproteobacteria bacterium]|nr:metallophosphoesterase family protein [Gammaproteobacteria bacterium]
MSEAASTLRVALLSDTHGYLDPRIARLVEDCDIAVHGGDIGGFGVLRELQPRLGRVVVVRGNNDTPRDWAGKDTTGLADLPRLAELDLPGGRLVVIHGHRSGPLYERHERLRRRFHDARAIVVGHSHRQACDCEGEPWVLNPGAAGKYRTFGGPGCLVLTAARHDWLVERYRFDPLRRRGGMRRRSAAERARAHLAP